MNRKGRRKYIKNRLNDRQEKKEPRIKCFHSIILPKNQITKKNLSNCHAQRVIMEILMDLTLWYIIWYTLHLDVTPGEQRNFSFKRILIRRILEI